MAHIITVTGFQLSEERMEGPVGKKVLDDAAAKLQNIKPDRERDGSTLAMQVSHRLETRLSCCVVLAYEGDNGYYMIIPKAKDGEIFDEAAKTRFGDAASKLCGVQVRWETLKNVNEQET